MSTSKRSYSKYFSLSGNNDTHNNHLDKFQYPTENNIPRFIKHSPSSRISNSFKISKRRSLSSTSSSSPSPLSSSTSLLCSNRFSDARNLDTYNSSDSDDYDIISTYRNNNYFHLGSGKKILPMNRPTSFSYPCSNNKGKNISDHENTQMINPLVFNSDDLESYIINDTSNISVNKKNHLPREDIVARERCFDYIVQAIDEVWARYCDTTSSAEVDMYDSWNIVKRQKLSNASDNRNTNKPTRFYYNKSIQYSDDDDNDDDDREDDQIFDHKTSVLVDEQKGQNIQNNTDIINEDDEDGYKTEVTEYETDTGSVYRTVSKLPDSIRLESLKIRLTKAKNDLEQVYDSMQLDDSIIFWKRWDMIKYTVIEVMEDDDDDEVVEDAIKELENGRYFHE